MAAVAYSAAGTLASSSGDVSSLSVSWPSSSAGKLGLLVVTFQFDSSAVADAPTGWKLIDSKSGIFVFSKLAGSSESAVSVQVRSRFGDKVSDVVGRIFTFSNCLRATKRGRAITVGSDNAGAWVTRNEFDDSGVTEQTIGLNFTLGYRTSAGFYQPTQEVSSDPIIGMELESRVGPSLPTIISPSAGLELSNTESVVFRWLHNGFAGQAKFKIRVREVGESTWNYVQSDGTLTTTETEVTSSQETIAVPITELPETAYEWSMWTFDGQEWSPLMPTQSFTLVSPPDVTVTAPSAEVEDDLSPTVEWSATFSGARSQVAFRVEVIGGDGATVYDSGVILGSQTAYTIPAQDDFVNGESFTFKVTLTQTGGASGSGSTSQVVSWTPPTAPTVVVANTEPGVQVTVTADVDTVIDIQRTVDGSTWVDVGVGIPKRTSADLVVHDVLAPYGVAATYRVRSGTTLEGMKLATDWVESDPITSSDAEFYIVDSHDPLTYAAPVLQEDSGRAFVRSGSLVYPIGASQAVVDYGPLQGDSGSCTVLTMTQSEADDVKALLTSGRAVWLRWPPDSGVDVPASRVTVTPDSVVHERRYQLNQPYRDWPFKWVEQPA